LPGALSSARREGKASSAMTGCWSRNMSPTPRHIEIQVFGDTTAMWCICSSATARAAPASEGDRGSAGAGMPEDMRAAMGAAAVKAAKAIDYSGCGDGRVHRRWLGRAQGRPFWFMEMNTRLQVEHPVTELITGLDLVEWQIRVAAGEPLPFGRTSWRSTAMPSRRGSMPRMRPKGFLPASARWMHLAFPMAHPQRCGCACGRRDHAVLRSDDCQGDRAWGQPDLPLVTTPLTYSWCPVRRTG
jgi:3-methylcrotonyl-CoA carboxylase alpha subunit